MKKNSTFLKGMFVLCLGISGFQVNAQYCIPEPLFCEFGDKLTNVKINNLENTSDCSNDGYQDYTTSVTPFELKAGGTNQFDITVENGNYEETVMVWIDFNKNNIFDANEYFLIGAAEFEDYGTGETKTISKAINLPSTVEEGQYRMRVKILDGLDEDPSFSCDVYFWDDEGQVEFRWPFGEVEDYLVNITKQQEITYCAPVDIMCDDDDAIHKVTFGTINNSSTCEEGGISDYTTQSTQVQKGKSYPISVVIGSGWKYESVAAWIDYNQDGVFTENEFTLIGTHVYPSNSNNGLTAELKNEIVIPEDALNGATRMRLRIRATGSDQPDITYDAICEDEDFGEIEDYTIIIGDKLATTEVVKSTFNIVKRNHENVVLSTDLMTEINLYSIAGQKVKTYKVSTKEFVIPKDLPKGVYVLKAKTKEGKELIKKVIL